MISLSPEGKISWRKHLEQRMAQCEIVTGDDCDEGQQHRDDCEAKREAGRAKAKAKAGEDIYSTMRKFSVANRRKKERLASEARSSMD